MADEIKRKPGRPKGTTKDDNRIKISATLPLFWVMFLRGLTKTTKFSQSDHIERALEDYKMKIESGENNGK